MGKGLSIDCILMQKTHTGPTHLDIMLEVRSLVLAEPGLVSLNIVSNDVALNSTKCKLTRTRRPIMYMLAPRLLNMMTLKPGTRYFPRA